MLTYTDHAGTIREVRGCKLTVDKLGRHWIWSGQTQSNLVHMTKGRENAIIAALDHALFIMNLKDERINALQRIVDLASAFAAQIKPDENDD
jgi:hypothetical protein